MLFKRFLPLAVACIGVLAGERDAAIKSAMLEMIAKSEVPGAVTVVVTPKGNAHLAAVGHADPAKSRKLRKDSIFWIASMTKPITAVAVLMLQDEGKLSIEDPVSKYIPELSNSVTLRHMLTHTSGMGEATPQELAAAKKLADLVPVYAKKPFGFTPGSQWRYCQSGINMLGRVVEVVSGRPFEDFIAERLFKPLGMKDTTFYLTTAQMPRLTTPARFEAGKLIDAKITFLQGHEPTDTNRYVGPNGGLFSTGPDYARLPVCCCAEENSTASDTYRKLRLNS